MAGLTPDDQKTLYGSQMDLRWLGQFARYGHDVTGAHSGPIECPREDDLEQTLSGSAILEDM